MTLVQTIRGAAGFASQAPKSGRGARAVRLCAAVAALSVSLGIAHSHENSECLSCHGRAEFAARMPDGSAVSLFVDAERYQGSVHGGQACTACHIDLAAGTHKGDGGEPGAPGEVAPGALADVGQLHANDRLSLGRCTKCHEEQAKLYAEGIHGSQALAGNHDAPDCVTCHGSHYVLGGQDIESSVSEAGVPRTCAQCHEDSRLMAGYDIATGTVVTFEESFHGRKLALGVKAVAVCTSCHGVHDMFALDDPRSSLYPGNRVETCGECHTDADEWFAEGFSHKMPGPRTEPAAFWVEVAYRWIIRLTIGAMACYVILDLGRNVISLRRKR